MSAEPRGGSDVLGAVVTGASYRGLAVVRSLGRNGVPVHLVRTDDHSMACESSYTTEVSHWPTLDAITSDSAHSDAAHSDTARLDTARLEHLLAIGRRADRAGWVLIPSHDDEAHFIARHHAELSEVFTLTTSTLDEFLLANDKRRLHDIADESGVDRPSMMTPGSLSAVKSYDGDFPVVIKPAFKKTANPLTNDKAWLATDQADLEEKFEAALSYEPAEALMLQEWVPGGGDQQFSVAVLARDGKILTSLHARRTRQWPADFGRASTFVETTAPDVDRALATERLIERLNFTGIAELEFKQSVDGRPLLLDVNTRAWGWISLCADAGVDFPWLLFQLAAGREIDVAIAQPGVRWVRLATDAASTVRGIRSPGGLVSWLQSLRTPISLAVFDRRDVRPAVMSPIQTATLMLTRKIPVLRRS